MERSEFEEFVASFNARKVRYLIVGAHALAYHGAPRATKDLDLLVEPVRENAERVAAAVRDFYRGLDIGLSVDDLSGPGAIIQLGRAPARVDLLTSIDGIPSFGSAWAGRVRGKFGSQAAAFLSLKDLRSAKEAAGRPQDLADLDTLDKARRPRRKRREIRKSGRRSG